MSMIDEVKTRTDDAPCGMRNVGSSCWYNAVIQCMFHVPALRRRILSSELRGTSLSTEFDAIRKTFTLLKGSKKSTIETADYVQVFKAHMPSGSTQQDVSEFVHKLLDVCESALKPEGTANAENPIKKLFYGTLKEIGKTDEEKVSLFCYYGGFLFGWCWWFFWRRLFDWLFFGWLWWRWCRLFSRWCWCIFAI